MTKPKVKTVFINVLLSSILLGSAVSTMYVQNQVDDKRTQIRHFNDVFKACDSVYSDMRDMESGQRGYLLTGKESYLDPYKSADATYIKDLKTYREAVQTDEERIVYDLVEKLVNEKTHELKETVDLYQSGKTKEALGVVNSDFGKNKMEVLGKIIKGMRERQNDAIISFRKMLGKRSWYFVVTIFFAVYYIIYSISKYHIEKKVAQQNAAIVFEMKRMQKDWETRMEKSLSYNPWENIPSKSTESFIHAKSDN